MMTTDNKGKGAWMNASSADSLKDAIREVLDVRGFDDEPESFDHLCELYSQAAEAARYLSHVRSHLKEKILEHEAVLASANPSSARIIGDGYQVNVTRRTNYFWNNAKLSEAYWHEDPEVRKEARDLMKQPEYAVHRGRWEIVQNANPFGDSSRAKAFRLFQDALEGTGPGLTSIQVSPVKDEE